MIGGQTPHFHGQHAGLVHGKLQHHCSLAVFQAQEHLSTVAAAAAANEIGVNRYHNFSFSGAAQSRGWRI